MRDRFFVEGVHAVGDRIAFAPDDARKLATVLRKRSGDRVQVVDSGGVAYGATLDVDGRSVGATLDERLERGDVETALRITIAQAVPKGQKMDLVVEKATELGAHAIVPVRSARVIGHDTSPAKVERWRRIAKSAAQQSGRVRVPDVAGRSRLGCAARDVCELRPRLRSVGAGRTGAAAGGVRTRAHGRAERAGRHRAGGRVRGRRGRARARSRRARDLAGRRILRTETAALVVLAALLYASRRAVSPQRASERRRLRLQAGRESRRRRPRRAGRPRARRGRRAACRSRSKRSCGSPRSASTSARCAARRTLADGWRPGWDFAGHRRARRARRQRPAGRRARRRDAGRRRLGRAARGRRPAASGRASRRRVVRARRDAADRGAHRALRAGQARLAARPPRAGDRRVRRRRHLRDAAGAAGGSARRRARSSRREARRGRALCGRRLRRRRTRAPRATAARTTSILESVGGAVFASALQLLAQDGLLVTFGTSADRTQHDRRRAVLRARRAFGLRVHHLPRAPARTGGTRARAARGAARCRQARRAHRRRAAGRA